jgi:hypothetical protein
MSTAGKQSGARQKKKHRNSSSGVLYLASTSASTCNLHSVQAMEVPQMKPCLIDYDYCAGRNFVSSYLMNPAGFKWDPQSKWDSRFCKNILQLHTSSTYAEVSSGNLM